MKTVLLSLVVMMASGCGVEDLSVVRYEAGCLKQIYSEVPLDMPNVRRNVSLARRMIIDVGAVANEQEFCDLFGEMPIRVRNTDSLGDGLVGRYNIFHGIELTRGMEPLLHEMFHAVDSTHLQLGTSWHEGWETNGYLEAEKVYSHKVLQAYIFVF